MMNKRNNSSLACNLWHIINAFVLITFLMSCGGGGGGGSSSTPTPTTTTAATVSAVTLSATAPTIGVGLTTKATAGATDSDGNAVSDATFTYASADSSIASVATDGTVTGVAAGTTTLTATSAGITSSTVSMKVVSSAMNKAILYTGTMPTPADVTYINSDGTSVTVDAYPGQVEIAVTASTSVSTVTTLVTNLGGTILEQFPDLGLYLISVSVGNESTFITAALADALVLSAAPNLHIDLETVDLSTTTDPTSLVTALISSPDPNATVILAQVDNFTTSTHGDKVKTIRESITGSVPSLQLQAKTLPCRSPGTSICTSTSQAVKGLTAIIAGAEINNQKVSINMSWGVKPRTTDATQFDTTNGAGANAWAVAEWEAYSKKILDVLVASNWAKNGNVMINKSAGNGAKLVDATGTQIGSSTGIDISAAIARLKADSRYTDAMANNIRFYGAIDSAGALKSYTNHGTDVIYGVPPATAGEGTSYVAPQGQGAIYNAWKNNTALKSGQIAGSVDSSADNNANGFAVLDVSGTNTDATAITSFTSDLVGTWTGTYNSSGPGDGGCTYSNGGNMTMIITSASSSSVSGSSSITGIQLRFTNNCAIAGNTSSSNGSVSGTISGTTLTGSNSYPVSETGGTLGLSYTATISGTTMTGTITGGDTGSFTLTKQ